MGTVDLQQFGEMVHAVKANSEAIKELKTSVQKVGADLREENKSFYKRFEGHMEQEERERKEMIALIASSNENNEETIAKMRKAFEEENKAMKEDYKYFKRLAGLFGTVIGIIWPLLIPFLQGRVETALTPGEIAAEFISHLPW